jgi:hypothetical protein
MAVRLDKWQNIVGVGWGGVRGVLMVTNQPFSGMGTDTTFTELGKATVEEMIAKDVPLGGWIIQPDSNTQPGSIGYRRAINLRFASTLTGPIIFRTYANGFWTPSLGEDEPTITGTTDFSFYSNTPGFPIVPDDLLPHRDGFGFIQMYSYIGPFDTNIVGTRSWAHGPQDVAWRFQQNNGEGKGFYINYQIDPKTGEVGEAFFTSGLTDVY